nr:uncharacterized protein CCDC162P [Pelodiscus sinensis]|eukprot:XP_006123306.1 uncharacterized protein CCDC162P [Pelodiscus sinensis]
MGFDEFHLYLKPVHFEFASHKEKADQSPPIFIIALLEDDSSVNRYIPSTLLLSIQEIDNNQIGKFTFNTRDGFIQLLSPSAVENMQITLACQVTQKKCSYCCCSVSLILSYDPAYTNNGHKGQQLFISLTPQLGANVMCKR